MRLHLDTDLGANPDDAAALVALLGLADVEVVGITTNLEVAGRRAGCVHHYLRLAGRDDIPVAAGAPQPNGLPDRYRPTWGDPRYWPDPVEPAPGPPEAALDLIDASIAVGATVCTIGALTNLAALERRVPGRLRGARVVTMGGCVDRFDDDLPPWGPERDFNLQVDTAATADVLDAGADLTLVQLPAAVRAQLRERDLDRLGRAGAAGALLARQSLAHGDRVGYRQLAGEYPGLADDLVNIQWDPVAVAVATGWTGAHITHRRLRVTVENRGRHGPDDGDEHRGPRGGASRVADRGLLRLADDPDGLPVDVVTHVDGAGFTDWWLRAVEASDATT